MKVHTFTTRLLQLNTYLAYFPPVREGQTVTPFPEDDVKEILYHTMPNMWKKKMVEKGYNYLDSSTQQMTEFFATMIENLERFDSKKDLKRGTKETKPTRKTRSGNTTTTVFRKTGFPKVLKLVKYFASIIIDVDTLPTSVC